MASSTLRRSLPQRGSLRSLLPSQPQSPAAAAASSFRRSFQSGEGESVTEFEDRLFGDQKGSDERPFFRKLDGAGSSFGRYGMGSGLGAFGRYGDRGNSGFGDRSSSGIMDGFDSLNDGMNEKLDDAARTFHMTEVEDDDYDFRPDVNYRRGSTYNVRDLDLTRPAAPRNPPRPQFETSTKEVLRKADFRVRGAGRAGETERDEGTGAAFWRDDRAIYFPPRRDDRAIYFPPRRDPGEFQRMRRDQGESPPRRDAFWGKRQGTGAQGASPSGDRRKMIEQGGDLFRRGGLFRRGALFQQGELFR